MTKLYEGMFLLDNEVVRQDWKRAKELVTGTVEKHGGKVHAARRWDERRLAYPIKRRRRATYLLAYYECPPEHLNALSRDLELSEPILRYLLTATEAVPDQERKLSELEQSDDFSVPPPPEDDVVEAEARSEDEDEFSDEDGDAPRARRGRRQDDEDSDEDAEGGDEDEEEDE